VGRARWIHQQVFARVVAAQDHVVHLADVHQLGAARVADGALHVLLHLDQRVGQLALDGLQDALAFHVLVFALVEVAGRAVVLLEQLAIHFHGLAGRFFVARKQRADHHHGGAKADALGDVAMAADAAVGNDGLGGHAGAPLERDSCQPPVPKPVLSLVMQTLPGPTPTLVASAPQFSRSITASGVATLPAITKALGIFFLEVAIMSLHAVGMAVGDVDGDVFGHQALGHQLVHGGVVGRLHAQRDRGIQPLAACRARTARCPGQSGA
jgi:hypothetical protein